MLNTCILSCFSYYVSIYRCDNPFKDSFPNAVSLTKKPCSNSYETTLRISYLLENNPTKNHWCLSPIFGSPKIDLTESMALHKTIGIDSATFYVQNDEMIKKLNKIDWIKAVKWSVPVPLEDIHYHGQCAAMNDCLYQNMFSAKYMVFTDLDEIFLPRRANKSNISYSKLLWSEIEYIQGKYKNTIGTFYLKSALFPTPFDFSGTASLTITKRYDELQNRRKKYIILPERIYLLGIHETLLMGDYKSVYINKNISLLHHYRRCRTPKIGCMGFDTNKDKIITDNFALTLKYKLKNLQKQYKKLLT